MTLYIPNLIMIAPNLQNTLTVTTKQQYNETIWTYFVKIEDRKCRNKQMSYFETANYVRVTLISAYSIAVGRGQMDCLPLKTYKSQGW